MNPELGFSIGSTVCPGLSKLIEECGEVCQVAGKIIATGGKPDHWDGTNLQVRLAEELADLSAAIDFVILHNGVDPTEFLKRTQKKLDQFQEWHNKQQGKP